MRLPINSPEPGGEEYLMIEKASTKAEQDRNSPTASLLPDGERVAMSREDRHLKLL